MNEPGKKQLTDELAEANKGRWEIVGILLGKHDGDIEQLWPEAVEVARALMKSEAA